MMCGVNDAEKKSSERAAAWGLDLEAWQAQLVEWHEPAFRAKQIWQWLHGRLSRDWNEMANLPTALRQKLAEHFDIEALTVSEVRSDPDGVRKLLCKCRDGELVEAVLIPSENRWTLCISSQAGCAFGCAFCASGAAGLSRSLEAGEIAGQVILAARLLREEQARSARPAAPDAILARPHNIVVMGMGEPLSNYDAVIGALRILNAPEGLNIGARHITISTCGVAPGIQRLAEEGLQFELSVSLHAPNNALRSRLMPVNKRWPLAELLAVCRDYTERTKRLITFEYTLVRGVNDAPEHARELAERLRGWLCRVNLIPLSPVAEFNGEPPEMRTCEAFRNALEQAGINTTLRRSRGKGVDAACGQLRLRRRREASESS